LSDPEGQKRILSLLGIPQDRMICGEDVHLHQSDGG
jgi:hypothetical protein